jgi:large subunit ribosomal protein L18
MIKKELAKRIEGRRRRRLRIRKKIFGTPECPRFTVFRSNRHIYAQIIDDMKGITLVSASSLKLKDDKREKKEIAYKVGEIIGERAKSKGIEYVVFDRGGYRYTGRIKRLAEGARKYLKF